MKRATAIWRRRQCTSASGVAWSMMRVQRRGGSMTPTTQALAETLMDATAKNAVDDTIEWQRQRLALTQSITLLESASPVHQQQASALLTCLLQHHARPTDAPQSFRIGFAGSPGAGKSSLLEAFGVFLLNHHASMDASTSLTLRDATVQSDAASDSSYLPIDQLAVVCIDPSSLRTGGSILGDKTRMPRLSSDPRAYIRPAPAQGILGGLAPRTNDVLRLLSWHYPLVWLETVGLGQSEIEAVHAVDMLILVVPPGGGDDVQGFKKGIVEVADLIVVTKADGDLRATAQHTAGDYRGALQFLHRVTSKFDATDSNDTVQHSYETPKVLLTSAVTGHGLDGLWREIVDFRHRQVDAGRLEHRRRQQRRYWMWKYAQDAMLEQLSSRNAALRQAAESILHELDADRIPPRVAVSLLLQQLPHACD